ncbi:MAG: glycoside hydrolase family 97 protein [Sedimentisphaerales bacterium]|nr:glycoside hydrolase family 97 protein [Sedimentisphaerales bacterium]
MIKTERTMMNNFKIALVLYTICLIFSSSMFAEEYVVNSFDGKINLNVSVKEQILYSVKYDSKLILASSPISMQIDSNIMIGKNPNVLKTETRKVDNIIIPPVKIKSKEIIDQYNELKIDFEESYSLIFRVYNDGVAYRLVTDIDKEIEVINELVLFNFPENHSVYFHEEDSFITHSERMYKYIKLSEISDNNMCSLPTLIDISDGPKVLITESDLKDYPGLYLYGVNSQSLIGQFPHYVLADRMSDDRNPVVTQRANYIAKTNGKRSYPWRIMIIAAKDGDLIESQMVYKLASPSKIEDTSWIKPGKVAWDWWNANNIYGVDFKSGVNTETYKYYIDFASKYGIEYIILDEGWYVLGDLMDVVDDMDVEELFRYAKTKNVKIIPWVIWKTLDDQLPQAMEQFAKWGAAGLKVDFMQRDDQWMVNYYYRIAEETAKHKMLVDFHGAHKPAGLQREYPNFITNEGVQGLEHTKWSANETPEHNVTLPFIRMVAGPMDYTPGAMVNAQQNNFYDAFERPMSQGTRCHQLAMYVVYESPLQMLCDSPSNYLKEPECMEFLSKVPTVWDQTKVLDARVGDYVIVARKNGDQWYIGAMTDWTARELTIDFSFLPSGSHTMTLYRDGVNADRYASDYKKETVKIEAGDKFQIKLAPGGGWAAIID